MMNCTKGIIDDSNFSKPMPIIGLYIAGATWLCIIAMIVHLVKGLRSKQSWSPSSYFSIDAASLTVIGIAIKLSVDLNSPMPSQIDQLAKLATSAFMCTALANIIPSLGNLEKGELLANTIAVAILTITSIVNLCIQLKTGVIHAFKNAHIFMIVMMSLLLCHCLSVATSLPITKNYLLLRYEKLHQRALQESFGVNNEHTKKSTKMEEYLTKLSMLAQSSCPQFVMSRSPSLRLIIAFHSIMPASTLLFVLSASITHLDDKLVGLNTCSGESDYAWSVVVILVSQAIAVVMGWFNPLSRMIYYKKARKVGRTTSRLRNEESLQVEKFWRQHMNQSAEDPVFLHIEDRQQSRLVYRMKAYLSQLIYFFQLNTTRFTWIAMKGRTSSNSSNQKLNDLRRYFVHGQHEERFLVIMNLVESCSSVTDKCINAEKRGPKHLIEFLEKNLSHDFGGVLSFESDQVDPLNSSDGHPPNCWALPLLTLTCIATALPNVDPTSKERLRKCVIEGLVYVKLVEDNLNAVHDLANIRAAAHVVWFGLDSGHWFGKRFDKLARSSESPKEVLSKLAEYAEKCFSRFSSTRFPNILIAAIRKLVKTDRRKTSPPTRLGICMAVAAHSMYKICRTILQDCHNENNLDPSSDYIFKKLSKSIADILGACFTNLSQCILLECKRSTIVKRRETTFRMLKIFGETKRIMEILEEEGRKIPELADDKMAFIDEWRSYLASHWTDEQSQTENNQLDNV